MIAMTVVANTATTYPLREIRLIGGLCKDVSLQNMRIASGEMELKLPSRKIR